MSGSGNSIDNDNNSAELSLPIKLRQLQDIRHLIKRRKIIFDESKERFGFQELTQLVKVKNTSQIKGYPFRCSGDTGIRTKNTKSVDLGLKIVPIETKYAKAEHPCYLETLILKALTDNIVNKNISPHFTYYLGTQKVSNKCRALKMLNLKRLEVEGCIRTHSNVLLSEFVQGGSLDNWVFNTYENDQEISDGQWKILVFQLIYTIAIIQRYYRMMHNDFHYGNILIDTNIKPGGYFVYEISGKTYYIPNTGIIPKLWDFEFCMVYSDKIEGCYPNRFIVGPYEYDRKQHKTIVPEQAIDKNKRSETKHSEHSEHSERTEDLNVPFNYNEVYDLHYFLTSLLDLYISQELFDWILKVYPQEVIPEDTSTETTETSTETTSTITETSDTTTSSMSLTTSLSTSSSSELSFSDSDCSSSDASSSAERVYLSEGRLVNGVEQEFELPKPLDLLHSGFFEMFTVKPDDFDQRTDTLYFRAGF